MSDYLSAGRLEDHPFPALAGRIFREGRSGALTLASGGHHRTVWFVGGNPAAVLSDDPQDHLARFLLEHGRINQEEHARLAALPETREAFANIDFLAKDSLNWGVKFRFVNLCYDLFRWEEGDYSFAEGNPPRELFLLKVPTHSLIFKGVGYLARMRLVDLVPDESQLGPGEISAEQARYLAPAERALLEECRPGGTVGAFLAGGSDEDREQRRALLYAFDCLGLISLSAGAVPAVAPAPQEDDAAFSIEEPPAAGDAFVLPTDALRGETEFTLPPLDVPAPGTPGQSFAAALEAAAEGAGGLGFDEGGAGGRAGSFDDSFSAETVEQQAAPVRQAPPAPRPRSPLPARGRRLPRVAGIALGTIAGCAIIGAAAWWWLSSEEPSTAPPVTSFAKKPAPPVAPPAPVATAPASPPAPPPPGPHPASLAAGAPPPVAQTPQVAAGSQAPATSPAAPPAAPPTRTAAPAPAAARSPASADRYRNGLDIFRAGDFDGAAAIWEDILTLEHRDAFTILLLTACQRETIRDAQQALAARRLYLVPKQVNGRNCFRVCVDTFDSREAAARALPLLPAEFRAAGAAVRPVADVLARNR